MAMWINSTKHPLFGLALAHRCSLARMKNYIFFCHCPEKRNTHTFSRTWLNNFVTGLGSKDVPVFGIPVPMQRAWIKRNIGKRFVGCARYQDASACRSFEWIDLPTCARGRELLEEMKKKSQNLEDEIGDCHAREVEL